MYQGNPTNKVYSSAWDLYRGDKVSWQRHELWPSKIR